MSQAFSYVAQGGRLVFVGLTADEVSFPYLPCFTNARARCCARAMHCRTILGSIISLIETGRIDTRPWITHRCGFDELIENFPSYTRPETGVIKAIVDVGR